MGAIQISLPWPPSINHYWRKSPKGMYISKAGKLYRKKVFYLCHGKRNNFTEQDRIYLKILAYPPDKRKRDLDNTLKCTLDSLQKANVFYDDEQIDHLEIIRMPERDSKIEIHIKAI